MDDKVLEELKFHQETLESDAHSPLHLIREKEMEISGRVLAAKREAEEIVSAARKKSVDVVARAEEESQVLARECEKNVQEEVDQEIVKIKADADTEAADLERLLAERTDAAADFIVDTVLSV